MPDKDDQWVLLGLSIMLLRLYYARMLKESSPSVDPIYSFYDSLQERWIDCTSYSFTYMVH